MFRPTLILLTSIPMLYETVMMDKDVDDDDKKKRTFNTDTVRYGSLIVYAWLLISIILAPWLESLIGSFGVLFFHLSSELSVLIFCCFVVPYEKQKQRKEEEEEERALAEAAKTALAKEGGAPGEEVFETLPKELSDVAVESWKKFRLNLDQNKSCDGEPWKLLVDKPELKIYNCNLPGESWKRWKIEATVEGDSKLLDSEVINYDTRISGWDTALLYGKTHKIYVPPEGVEADNAVVVTYATTPAAGGSVPSRQFMDLGLFRHYKVEGEDNENLAIEFSMVGLDRKKFKKYCPPEDKRGFVQGNTFSGCGLLLVPLETTLPCRKWKYTLISAIDLGGWLMPSLVNSATTQALTEQTENMIAHMRKKNKAMNGA